MAVEGREPVFADRLRTGVWRRAKWDWAYRVEVAGYGSIVGLGFSTRERAREAMQKAKADAEQRAANSHSEPAE